MIIFPAIDLKAGRCVRLKKGELATATVFNDDPVDQARIFQGAGFSWLHCVDLDGAFEGRSVNGDAVRAIHKSVMLPIQLGGGIRSRATIEAWLEAGISRLILGTLALREPDLVREAAKAHPGKIAVGIDARDGKVAVEGWAQSSEVDALELGRRFEDAGVAAIVFTDIAHDGMMAGMNVEATSRLASAIRIPVIASGGVGRIEHIEDVIRASNPNILGIIIGRALYDGRIDARKALTLASARSGTRFG